MKTKIAIVGVVAALMPNLAAYAGESQASSSAMTQSQSSAANQQSSQSITRTSSTSGGSPTSSATTQATTNATTSNPNNRGRVVSGTPASVAAARRGETEPKLYRARVRSAAKTYYPGYKKRGATTKTSSTHWQTKTWR